MRVKGVVSSCACHKSAFQAVSVLLAAKNTHTMQKLVRIGYILEILSSKTRGFLFFSKKHSVSSFLGQLASKNMKYDIEGHKDLSLTRPIAISRVRREQRPTDQRTDRLTNKVAYRVACT